VCAGSRAIAKSGGVSPARPRFGKKRCPNAFAGSLKQLNCKQRCPIWLFVGWEEAELPPEYQRVGLDPCRPQSRTSVCAACPVNELLSRVCMPKVLQHPHSTRGNHAWQPKSVRRPKIPHERAIFRAQWVSPALGYPVRGRHCRAPTALQSSTMGPRPALPPSPPIDSTEGPRLCNPRCLLHYHPGAQTEMLIRRSGLRKHEALWSRSARKQSLVRNTPAFSKCRTTAPRPHAKSLPRHHSHSEPAPAGRGLTGHADACRSLRQTHRGLIADLVRSFKSAVTRRAGELLGMQGVKIWHRNYFEHIIRNKDDFQKTVQYIHDNPRRWEFDSENPFCRPREGLIF
jgi:hypothetical protein